MRGAHRIMIHSTCAGRYLAGIAILLVVLVSTAPAALAAQETAASTGIELTASEPRANAVLPTAPETVLLTFSTGVDTDASTIRILTQDGSDLEATVLSWRETRTAAITVPDDLPHGAYLVAWDVTANDGVEASGFYGFTVGTDQNVAPATIPDTGFDEPNALTWVSIAANGAIVLGLALLVAIWPIWTFALRPAAGVDRSQLQPVAVAGAIIAGTGVLAHIGTLAWSERGGGLPDRLLSSMSDTRTGPLLLGTLVLISAHSLLLALLPMEGKGRWAGAWPWLTTFALSFPLPLMSHAADEPASRVPALTVAWIAFGGLALVVGGAIVLAWLRITSPAALGRFGGIVSIALPVLAISGAYLAWLFAGNRAAFESTAYGTAALGTGIAALLFAVAVIGTLVMRAGPGTAKLLLIPAVAGVALAIGIGSLLSLDTARDELRRDASQRVMPFTRHGERAQLILAPGAAGVNHLRLELDRASIPLQTTATLTMRLPAQPELGSETVTLSRVADNAFEYHGTELAIAGRWELEVGVTEPERAPSVTTMALDLDRAATIGDLPATPWRFTDFAGSAGAVMVAIGIAGLVVGIAAGRSPLRKESAGLGIAALAFAAILLGQGRLDPILAMGGGQGGAINPDDLVMITRGEEVYTSYCLSCHGAELRGDGPAADGMQPPPADFSEPHTMAHDEATLIYWVRNGKQGAAMPAFGDTLSDEEIRAVLSYIERQQRDELSS